MANDRLYLHCKRCGATLTLAKSFGGRFEAYGGPEGMEGRVDDFLDEHFETCSLEGEPALHIFDITYDDEDAYQPDKKTGEWVACLNKLK